MASTICVRWCCISGGAFRSISINRPRNISCCGSPTALCRRRQRLSADPGFSPDRSRRKPDHRREGRLAGAVRIHPAARQHPGAGLPDRRCRLYARCQRHPARELARAGKSRSLDHRRAALHRPSQPFQRQRCAVMDRPLQAETRRDHQHAFGSGLRGAAPQPAAECDSGLRRHAADAGLIACPGRGAAFFMPLRRAGTVPSAAFRYGPGSAAHRFAKSAP